MKHLYQFQPDVILRAPVRPFHPGFDAATLQELLHDEAFLEALYLASPELCAECRKWQSGELQDPQKISKLTDTLARYYSRMTSRSTPFGLFAGCAVLGWGPETRVTLDATRAGRHTRLDMHYLCALAYQLADLDCVRQRLRYFPNSSLYPIGEEVRYVEHYYVQQERLHQVSSVEASESLRQVLEAARAGLTRPALAQLLADDEAEYEPALEYVDALIGAQVLVSELEPTVTGVEFYEHLQQVLGRLQAEAPEPMVQELLERLARVETLLRELDRNPANSPAQYELIVQELEPLGLPVQKNKLFQTDAVCGVTEGATLSEGIQNQLLEALEVLTYLTPAHKHERMEDFKNRFQARYEGRTVPLLTALDAESGLRYSDFGKSAYSPLVHDLALAGASKPRSMRQTDVQHYMYQKLREAERNRQYSIEITKEEVQGFGAAPNPLPPSLPVMFRLVDEGRIQLESASGSSAVNLLGRFAHADARMEQAIRAVTRQEQDHNPAVRFAEICHLPLSRIGNILQRPSFRDYELPFLAQSTLLPERQVRLQDLTLSLHGQQLVLRSSRTNEVIIPRLGTAHNYTHQALPVYEFLCDLQTQGLQPQLGFSWASVSLYAKFLPRLTFKNVVLVPASWQLQQADVQELLAAAPDQVEAPLQQLRSRWQLPRFFTLADGDNELLVDAENPTSVRVWLAAIRKRAVFKLKEYLLPAQASLVQDAAGRPYAHQLVAILVRQTPCYTELGRPHVARAEQPVVRTFGVGSEWLYYKLYCGQKVANRLLVEVVGPLTEALQERGLIDQWFFIRYADPDNHLRLRLHLPDTGRTGDIVQLVHQYLEPYTQNGYIWKTQLDTYQRELERYGTRTMALSEALFCQSSRAVVAVLTEYGADDDFQPWLWALRQTEELLQAFDLSLAAKLALLHRLKEEFAREFGMNKALKLQLDAKYRHYRPQIQQALALQGLPGQTDPALQELAGQIRARHAQGPPEVELTHLLGSYIHMLVNRLIPIDARLHEMVLYDFLYRQYQSQQAMQKV